MVRLFMYGSLRAGQYNYERYLKGRSRFISYGYVKGALYTLRDVRYPALLPGEDMVLGEIYEVEEACAKQIDALEGYEEGNADNEYERTLCCVYDAQGVKIAHLPVYMYHMENKENRNRLGKRILHGDFCRYMKEET